MASPTMAAILHTRWLPLADWPQLVAIALLPATMLEASKILRRRHDESP